MPLVLQFGAGWARTRSQSIGPTAGGEQPLEIAKRFMYLVNVTAPGWENGTS